jgi:predicted acetyltransferase
MAVELRPARQDELADYLRVVKYVFAVPPGAGLQPEDDTWRVDPDHTVCAFVDGQLVSTYGAYDFTVRLNGAPVQMAGVTNVGTLPGYRRRGFIRKIVTQGLSDARDRRQSSAILWASYAAIYQRFGYGLASMWIDYHWDPRYGALTDRPAAGSTNRAATGQTDVVTFEEGRPIAEQVFSDYVAPRNLMIERDDARWNRTFDPEVASWKPHQMAVYRDAAGEPRGYLTFRNREVEDFQPGPNQYMTVSSFVALDVDAYRGLWNFLAAHDLVREIEMERVPEDDLALLLLEEPRALRRRTGDGLWMRIADVALALAQRPYGAAGALTIEVQDDVCDWNAGSYRLETDGPTAEVTRTAEAPDLTVPVARLAQLLSGFASASELARAGLIEADRSEALILADRIFATTYRPYCQDGF